MSLTITLLVINHIICSILAYGIVFAYLQRKWPTLAVFDSTSDRGYTFIVCFWVLIIGGFGLLITYYLFDYAKYGLKYKN